MLLDFYARTAKIYKYFMKYINYFLIIRLFLCYTKIDHALQRFLLPGVENHQHSNIDNATYGFKNTENHNKSIDNTNHDELECCGISIFSENNIKPKSLNYLYLLTFYNQNNDLNNELNSLTSPKDIKKRYRPPDIFLQNTTFLL